jgi:inorganic pyrophosphatase
MVQQEEDHIGLLLELGHKIHEGAMAFLKEEYTFCGIFITAFCFLLIFIVSGWCAIAFFIGGCTSMLCGYIGMLIATYSNYRVAYKAIDSLP